MVSQSKNRSLDLLFKPKTVAIFETKEKLSYFIRGFKSQGFNLDNLYLISPLKEEIFEIKCYKSFDQVPVDTIDLLILAVRREKLITSLIEITSKKKIKFIHIFTAGTGEFDYVGAEIEKELKDFFDKNNEIRGIGPNCMGVYCPSGHNAYLPMFPTDDENIGLIFHSGDLHSKTVRFAYGRYRLTFSKGASIGNCVNLQVTDFLEYFSDDSDIDIIGIYFEGFSKYQEYAGRKFFNVLSKIKKPILFLRGGMTKRARSAVLTHTGSLGPDERLWKAVYSQTPLIEVGSSLDELVDDLYMFQSFFKKYRNLLFEDQIKLYPKGKNVLVILYSGGLGIIDTDTLTKLGLNVPLFDDKTKEKLMNVYPIKIGSLSNPLDLPWASRSKKYMELCKVAVSENIDLVVMHTNVWGKRDPARFESYYNNLKMIRDYIEAQNKTLILILAETPHQYRNDYHELLIDDGFIVYPSIERGAKSFLKMYNYGNKMNRLFEI